jgi:hypothetical protein
MGRGLVNSRQVGGVSGTPYLPTRSAYSSSHRLGHLGVAELGGPAAGGGLFSLAYLFVSPRANCKRPLIDMSSILQPTTVPGQELESHHYHSPINLQPREEDNSTPTAV